MVLAPPLSKGMWADDGRSDDNANDGTVDGSAHASDDSDDIDSSEENDTITSNDSFNLPSTTCTTHRGAALHRATWKLLTVCEYALLSLHFF